MYDELYQQMMKKLSSMNEGFSKKLHSKNIDTFISVCIMEEINTFIIEEMIVTHSNFTSDYVITKLENYLEGKSKVIRPVERDGIRYDSLADMARELGISHSSAKYQMKKGIVRRVNDEV